MEVLAGLFGGKRTDVTRLESLNFVTPTHFYIYSVAWFDFGESRKYGVVVTPKYMAVNDAKSFFAWQCTIYIPASKVNVRRYCNSSMLVNANPFNTAIDSERINDYLARLVGRY